MELINHPLVTSTPHLGASTYEAQTKVAEEIAHLFVQFFTATSSSVTSPGSGGDVILTSLSDKNGVHH